MLLKSGAPQDRAPDFIFNFKGIKTFHTPNHPSIHGLCEPSRLHSSRPANAIKVLVLPNHRYNPIVLMKLGNKATSDRPRWWCSDTKLFKGKRYTIDHVSQTGNGLQEILIGLGKLGIVSKGEAESIVALAKEREVRTARKERVASVVRRADRLGLSVRKANGRKLNPADYLYSSAYGTNSKKI